MLTAAALLPAAAVAPDCAALPPVPLDRAPPSVGGRLLCWPCLPPLFPLCWQPRQRPRLPAVLRPGPLLLLQLPPARAGPLPPAACLLPAAAVRHPALPWQPAGRSIPGRAAGCRRARQRGRPVQTPAQVAQCVSGGEHGCQHGRSCADLCAGAASAAWPGQHACHCWDAPQGRGDNSRNLDSCRDPRGTTYRPEQLRDTCQQQATQRRPASRQAGQARRAAAMQAPTCARPSNVPRASSSRASDSSAGAVPASSACRARGSGARQSNSAHGCACGQ